MILHSRGPAPSQPGTGQRLVSSSPHEVVRGGSFVSLNNEAVARSIENFFGVTARKVAERAAWRRAVEEGCVTTTPNLLIDVVKN